jgi:subtilisin family serine protease
MMQGTSMATPHIAGITALLLEANPELTPEEVRDILQTTAVKDDYTGEVPNNFYGMGKVDALAAMQNVVTSVESDNIPKKFSLSQNYPNPFNPVTKIKYQVAKESQVTLRIYNILGQEIATLVDKKQKPGLYNVEFGNNIEKQLSSGVYLYRLKAGDFVSSKKMMLLK